MFLTNYQLQCCYNTKKELNKITQLLRRNLVLESILINFFTNLGYIVGFSQGIKVQRWNAKCF